MVVNPDVPQGLALVRAQTDGVLADLRALTSDEWARRTPCAPWDVAMLAAHLALGADFFTSTIRLGLRNEHAPEHTREERAADAAALAARGVAAVVEALAASADRFELTVRAVPPLKLDTLAYHNHGLRPVRWFVLHRLAELLVHRWDLGTAVGRAAAPDAAAAVHLLPTAMERNLPVWYERGARGRGQVRVVTREPTPRAWLLDADGTQLRVLWHGEGVAPRVDLAPEDLLLVLYGRVTLADLAAAGRVQAHGQGAVDLLASLLGPP